MDDDHPFYADDEDNNLCQLLIEAVPRQLLEFYFNDNATIKDEDSKVFLEKINYRIKNHCHEVFGIVIEPLNYLHGYIHRLKTL